MSIASLQEQRKNKLQEEATARANQQQIEAEHAAAPALQALADARRAQTDAELAAAPALKILAEAREKQALAEFQLFQVQQQGIKFHCIDVHFDQS